MTFSKMGQEGYVLVVDKPSFIRISIGANDNLGLWNGAMTALQLLQTPENEIYLQTLKDWPDHAFRGASWLNVKLPQDSTGKYIVPDSVRQKIVFLQRHKANALLYSQPEIAVHSDLWSDALGAQATRALATYCDSLSIGFIPTAPIVYPMRILLNQSPYYDVTAWRREYYDGWFNHVGLS